MYVQYMYINALVKQYSMYYFLTFFFYKTCMFNHVHTCPYKIIAYQPYVCIYNHVQCQT